MTILHLADSFFPLSFVCLFCVAFFFYTLMKYKDVWITQSKQVRETKASGVFCHITTLLLFCSMYCACKWSHPVLCVQEKNKPFWYFIWVGKYSYRHIFSSPSQDRSSFWYQGSLIVMYLSFICLFVPLDKNDVLTNPNLILYTVLAVRGAQIDRRSWGKWIKQKEMCVCVCVLLIFYNFLFILSVSLSQKKYIFKK